MIINLQPGPADRLPCTLASADQSYSLSNPSEGYKLAQGISLLNNITTISSSKTSISILLPSNPHPDLDWRAKTIGVTTQCENIATKCMNPSGSIGFSNQEFNCSKSVGFPSEFSGKMGIHQGGTMWNWTLFPNALPENTSSIEYNLPNPYNFVLQAVGTEKPQDKLTKDPDMIVRDNFVSNTILKCNTTIYDVVYTSINGTITIEDHHSSNLNISQSINGPTIFSLLFAHPEQASLPSFVKSGFSTALFSSESAIEMAQRFANIYSRITLAFGSVALNPLETLVQQTRATSLVTCVPKAPLFALVGLAGLYLALAIILAVIAVRNTSGDVADIQSQLSISGLAATRFESTGSADDNSGGSGGNIEDIFEEFRGEFRKGETKRVAFTKQMGIGWEYTVVKA
jgi:hypothetical protein